MTDYSLAFLKAMADSGIYNPADVPAHVETSGNVVRFRVRKPTGSIADDGWYVYHQDPQRPWGAFGLWGTTSEQGIPWVADTGSRMTEQEQALFRQRQRDDAELRQKEKTAIQDKVAGECQKEWSRLQASPSNHPYLQRKGVQAHPGVRLEDAGPHEGSLVVPLGRFDASGNWNIRTLQFIPADPKDHKVLAYQGEAKGSFFPIGLSKVLQEGKEPSSLFVCEGYATGASIFEATGTPTIVAISAGNLSPVTKALRKRFPSSHLCLVADNDESETGLSNSRKAIAGDSNASCKLIRKPASAPSGFDANDFAREFGLDALRKELVVSSQFVHLPDSVREKLHQPTWLIQDVLPTDPYGQAGMLVGAPGIGKSFIAIDWACCVASGTYWQGHRVREPKVVVYLYGEGQSGVYARILAWLKHHQLEPEALRNLCLFCETADLDDRDSDLALQGTMQREGVHPDLVIIDTLNRYFAGEENSSRDARSFVNNFVTLMEKKFGATVVTIHHTPKGDGREMEARGSSAFKGAMDFEFAVTKDNRGIVLSQTKVKDGRPWASPMLFEFSEDIPIGEHYEPDEDGKTDVRSVVLLAKEPDGMASVNPKDREAKELMAKAMAQAGIEESGCYGITSNKLYDWLRKQNGMPKGSAWQAVYGPDPSPSRKVAYGLQQGWLKKGKDNLIVCDDPELEVLIKEEKKNLGL